MIQAHFIWEVIVIENCMEAEKARFAKKNERLKERISEEEMLKNLPGGFHCCSADDGYSFIYIGNGFTEMLGWTKTEIETNFENKYLNLVHPEDREQVMDYVAEISANHNDGRTKRSVYRLLGKDGYHWIADDDTLIEIDGERLFQGFITDITTYIQRRDQYQEQLEAQLDIERHYLDVLCWDYTSVYRVNLFHDIAVPLKVAFQTFVGDKMKIQLNKEYRFAQYLNYYCEHFVLPSDKKLFQRSLSVENILKKLKCNPRFTFRYRTLPSPGGHSCFEGQVIRIEGDVLNDGEILLSFRHIDDLVAEELRHQTELKEHVERERIQNEAFMALGSNYDAIFRIDLQQDSYIQILCNDKIKYYYSSNPSANEMLSEVCKKIVSPKHYERMQSFFDLKTLSERLKERDFVEEECITKNGVWHRARMIVKRRNKNGIATNVLYVTQIINDEKHYEEHLIAKAEYADLANRTKNSFISQVAHDIRTPMNSILGFLEIAESKLKKQEYDDVYYNLDKIRSSGEFLKNLVNDILDISRIEEGKFVLQPEPVKLSDMLENIKTNIQLASNKKEHTFNMEVYNICHNTIVTDVLRFMQIYTNILTNAIKYTPAGGTIGLTVFQEEIPSSDKVCTVAKISDTGIGMTEEFMKNMFNAFERATDTRINKVSGYGLGLTIVKQFIDMMGGSINAESELGKGTTFTVKLETAYLDEKATDAASNKETDYHIICRGKHLLIAEDNELNREVITELLLMNEITCECTEDGKSCLERFQAAEEGTFDAILMDLQMPIMNGIDATRNIRGLPIPWAKTVPIIAMTANAMKEDIKKCLDAGMNAHLSKPVDMKQVLKTLAKNIK